MVGTFELFDAGLEAGDSFAEELCPRLALSIVVLAEVLLFGTNALLAGRFRAIATLGTEDEYWEEGGEAGARRRMGWVTIFRFLDEARESSDG